MFESQGVARREEGDRCRAGRRSLDEAARALQEATENLQQEAAQVCRCLLSVCSLYVCHILLVSVIERYIFLLIVISSGWIVS